MIISRAWASPSKWTFTIPPIKELIYRYVRDGNNNWIDPFAGLYSPAQYRNDLNPEMRADYHMQADEFCRTIERGHMFSGVLFDPPYSYRQITECYQKLGLKATQLDTSYNYYNRVMNAVYKRIKMYEYAISFGWNTNGFGIRRGFEPVEILVVAHGLHHNDTLVVVEQRTKEGRIVTDIPADADRA